MLTIYKASAGSGKTFALAYEYIKLLLGIKQADGRYILNDARQGGAADEPLHNRHRCLLAITFTKAATAEMKSRIITQLDKLANIDDMPAPGETAYAEMLTRLYRCSRTALRTAAARSLRELLNDYGRFNVYTIDSFFQSVLRTFAREIDMQGDYTIALDRLEVIRQSVSLMLDEVNNSRPGENDRLYLWLKQQVCDLVDQGKTYNMFDRDGSILNSLSKAMDGLLDETFVKIASAMHTFMSDTSRVAAFREYLNRTTADACKAMHTVAAQTLQLFDDAGVTSDDFKYKHGQRLQRFAKDSYIPTSDDFTPKMNDFYAGRDVQYDLPSVLKKDSLDKLGEDAKACLAEAFGRTIRTAKVAWGRSDVAMKMKKAIVNIEFMMLVQQTMERYLRDTNTMLLADSGELLGKIISDSDTPFIYERLGVELQSLLIDEFQDTSRLQWHNLKPLVGNSLSTGHDDLIIGDVKQAIYRFRNSDPKLLGHTVSEEDFPAPAHIMRGRDAAENTNHRSSHQIVYFNNVLFDSLARRLRVDGYDGVCQTPDPRLKGIPGYVSVIKWPEEKKSNKKKKDADDAAGTAESTNTSASSVRALVLEQLAADIRRQHDAGYRWRDIMVLTRRNREASEIVEYLLEHHPDINVLSNEALLLRNSLSVRMAMSLLEMLERPMPAGDVDDTGVRRNANEVITEFNCRCQEYIVGGMDNSEAVVAALSDVQNRCTSDMLERIRHHNPANLVAAIEAIISELPAAMREQEQAYLTALQDKALEFSQGPIPSVAAFIETYKHNVETWTIQAGEGLDAVQVMTIHKSKGLEAPCVHIPFVSWALQRAESLWLPLDRIDLPDDAKPPMLRIEVKKGGSEADPAIWPELAEYVDAAAGETMADNLNLTYVAFTRARRELCVQTDSDPGREADSDDIGREVLKTLNEMVDTAQPAEMPLRRIDMPDAGTGVTKSIYTIGEPTAPVDAQERDEESTMRRHCTDPAAPYVVSHRDDTRAIVSIDDIFSDDMAIGDEYATSAVDDTDGTAESLLAARRGNAMHAILSDMNTPDGLDAAIAKYVAMGRTTASEAAEYRDILHDALRDAPDEVRSWFDPACRSWVERSIYDPTDDTTYRPDRVVLRPDGTIAIIDYKFTSKTLPEHRHQVRRYADLVKQIESTRAQEQIQAYLWYPLLKKVVKV